MSFKIKKKKYTFIRGPGEKLVSVLQCKLTPNPPSFTVQGRSSASIKPGSLTTIEPAWSYKFAVGFVVKKADDAISLAFLFMLLINSTCMAFRQSASVYK